MTDAQKQASAAAPKQDPESLVLRGKPRAVIRFRRGLVIGAAAAVSAGIIATTWLAFEPHAFRSVSERDQPELKGAPIDTLAGAPATYGDVPQLGPPLPGDLGRPILEHRRSLERGGQPLPEPHMAVDPALAERQRAADAERQRLVSAEQAARGSGVLVPLAQRPSAGGPAADAEARSMGEEGAIRPETARIDASRSSVLDPEESEAGLARLTAPRPGTLAVGTIISASLMTGLNSDLPGLVIAQVTEAVRDSATGRNVLVPPGAKLIGRYDSKIGFGQRRAMLVWHRLVFPNGSSIELGDMPATDRAGFAGLEDRVDFHTWQLISGVALSSMLGVGTELSLGSEEGDLVRAIRESAQQNASRAGDQVTRRNLEVQPTLRVRPGWPVRAIVHQELRLPLWRG